MSEGAMQVSPAPEPQVEVFARPGSRVDHDTAQLVYREASALPVHERNADGLIEKAKDPSSPLHGEFTWNDEEAGHKWRQQQARHLLASVHIRIVDESGIDERPAFFAVAFDEEPNQLKVYARYSETLGQKDLQEKILQNAWRDYKAFIKRYKTHEFLFIKRAPALAKFLAAADDALDRTNGQ